MSMELFCYKAECGDAMRIRYIGIDGNPHNIFLDSGYERTFRPILQQEINSLIQAHESIDLWIISHIHDDHIGGAIKYTKTIKDNEILDIVKIWYYNAPRGYTFDVKKNEISSAKSIKQADTLYEYLLKQNKLPLFDITNEIIYQDLWGLKIHILSPSSKTLNELRNKYKNGKAFERCEIDYISSAKSATKYDYIFPLESFDIDYFEEDDSIENGSSISALFEYQDKKILWLADSFPSIIEDSLSRIGYSIDNPIVCNYVIVSHHASKSNNSSSLYNMIKCDNYIISSNGENKYGLPTKEVLSRIICNKNRDIKASYSLFFTYDTTKLREIFLSDSNHIFNKWNFKTIYSNNKYCTFR